MPRHAFSLLELLIVLALVVVLAGTTIMTLRTPLSQQRLRSGSDVLRTTLGQARNQAIRQGIPYAVALQAESNTLSVVPWSASSLPTDVSAATADNDKDVTLPNGITVLDVSFATLAPDNALATTGTQQIVFFPDGTSVDVSITLRNENAEAITIHLHGLTSSCRLGSITSIESNAPQ